MDKKCNYRFLCLIFTVFIMLVSNNSVRAQEIKTNTTAITFQFFYDELEPYGRWISNTRYGYVWKPNAGTDFFPYGDNGYWIYSDWGWFWTSFYPWGWAAFHYGRWFYDPFYGWLWVPGYEWAPAWVIWRSCTGYYGWAPMYPGISIESAYNHGYYYPNESWRFVHNYDMGRKHISYRYMGIASIGGLLKQSQPIENKRLGGPDKTIFHAGPKITQVRAATGKGFMPVIIKTLQQPKEEKLPGELRIYKPNVQATEKTQPNPIPKKTEDWKSTPSKEPQEQKRLPVVTPDMNPRREQQQKQIQGGQKKSNEPLSPTIDPEKTQPLQRPVSPIHTEPPKTNIIQQNQTRKGINENNHLQPPAQDKLKTASPKIPVRPPVPNRPVIKQVPNKEK